MSKSQVSAGIALLKKTIPDLAAVDTTLHGDPNAPVSVTLSQTDANL